MARYLRWLAEKIRAPCDAAALAPAADAYERISTGAKTFILKAARAVNAKQPLDAAADVRRVGAAWQTAVTTLDAIR